MKLVDAIGAALIALGVAMAALNFLALHRPSADVGSVTTHKIPALSGQREGR
jgi:hypothetical protein